MAVSTRRSNAEIIFRALTKGIVVKKDGYRYVIRDGNFGILGRRTGNGGNFDEEVFLGLDWPLSSFIRWCNSEFTDSEAFAIGADTTLNELRQK